MLPIVLAVRLLRERFVAGLSPLLGPKTTFSLVAICLAISTTGLYLAHMPSVEGLTVLAPVRNLGELSQMVVVPVQFSLRNDCRTPIKILNVAKSCDCVNFELEREHLEPGQATTLTVHWQTGHSRGKSGTDVVAIYQTPDGREDSVRMRIRANILPDTLFEPTTLQFNAQKKDTKLVFFSSRGPAPVSLRRAYCSSPGFQARLLLKAASVEVQFDPARWARYSPRADLFVETDDPNNPKLIVPLLVATP